MSPTMVSQYTLKLIDKKLLENKLKEIANMVEENNDKWICGHNDLSQSRNVISSRLRKRKIKRKF